MDLNHFERTPGERFPVGQLTVADLQGHVTARARKRYRGRPLSPATLRKEVASLRAAWNWAASSRPRIVPRPPGTAQVADAAA